MKEDHVTIIVIILACIFFSYLLVQSYEHRYDHEPKEEIQNEIYI